ncbi:MAG: hypothetical protein ACBR12_08170 [Microcoleus sp.]
MFRTSWLTTLMSSAVCALVATSAIGEAVFAQIPGQKRVIYKISDINQSDADGFCKGRYGDNTSARLEPQNDRVVCSGLRTPIQTNTGVGVGGGDKRPTVTTNFTVGEPQWTESPHHLNEVCDKKHPTYGTWVGDGGRSCYDSYWRW